MCTYTTGEFDRLQNHARGLHPELFKAVKQYVEGSDITAPVEETPVLRGLDVLLPVDLWIKR